MRKKMFTPLIVLLIMAAAGAFLVLFPTEKSSAVSGAAQTAAADTATPKGSGTEGSEGADWKAPDQEAAKIRAKEFVPFVETVVDECLLCRSQRLREKGYDINDVTHSYFLLDSPIIKRQEDYYKPVRFMHSKHAAMLKDCTVCHHLRPTDANALETTRCSACHQESFRSDHPERIGLKAAYHINCIDCHKQMNKGPADCLGCHSKNVPDHKTLVKLPQNPEPSQVTQECLRCHQNAGTDMLSTVHWLWKGHSPYTLDHRKEVQHGKATTALNNF